MPVYFFYGTDDYRIDFEVQKLKTEFVDENFKSIGFRLYYSPEPKELQEICSAAPLMFGNTVSVIHCENYFFPVKNRIVDFDDEALKYLKEISANKVANSHHVIFVCNVPLKNNKKIDTRKKLFKILAENSSSKELNQFRDFDKDFIPYVSGMIKNLGLKADLNTVKYLTSKTGTDLRLINSELEKIKCGIMPENTITKKSIDEYCSVKEDIFAFADLIFNENKTEILRQYNILCDKMHPLEILALLQSSVKKTFYVKTNEKTMSAQNMATVLKMHEYPVKLLMNKIKNIPLNKIANFKRALTDAEFKIKTGKTLSPEQLLEAVILTGGENV